MLLAVRIRLEVMNVTAGRILLDATVKQVDTINTMLVGIHFFFPCIPFSYFFKLVSAGCLHRYTKTFR